MRFKLTNLNRDAVIHLSTPVEYYAQCVDIAITNPSAGGLPAGMFTIGTHLPADGNSYRNAFNGETFLVGPKPISSVEMGATLPPVVETPEPTSR
jgi:hypothetical protein